MRDDGTESLTVQWEAQYNHMPHHTPRAALCEPAPASRQKLGDGPFPAQPATFSHPGGGEAIRIWHQAMGCWIGPFTARMFTSADVD